LSLYLRKLITVACIFLNQVTFSQISDHFTDGDFIHNPTWNGDELNYEVNTSFLLHLNAPAQADTSYLSTPSSAIHNATWEFLVQMSLFSR